MDLIERSKCCGCGACYNVCPCKCISMYVDSEGFSYPMIDKNRCIDCSLCEKICPVLHPVQIAEKPVVFAAINNNAAIRERSSSGGIFTLLAERTIKKGGVVFGASFDENWRVVHQYTETMEGVARFRGSKYVQSDIGTSFQDAKHFLDQGREVLFSGTPCQIAGLKNYLRKSYSNLFTVDLVCHGTPSPDIWRKYLLETICKRLNLKNIKDLNIGDHISNICFRSKENGWKNFHVRFEYKNGEVESLPFYRNSYMSVFLSNLSLRPCCYSCPAKLYQIQSDITLADFWGVNEICPEIDDDKGCGLIFVNDKEKLELLDSLDCKLKRLFLDSIVEYNSSILNSVKEPINRSFFFFVYRMKGFYTSYQAVTSHSPLMRIIRKIYRYL